MLIIEWCTLARESIRIIRNNNEIIIKNNKEKKIKKVIRISQKRFMYKYRKELTRIVTRLNNFKNLSIEE